MYQALIFFHSIFRWLVLISLIYAIIRSYNGYTAKRVFTKDDNAARHWTATISHIQLMIGIMLYSQSPLIKYMFSNFKLAVQNKEAAFFGLIHITLMLTAIVFITVGSALAKRRESDRRKFKTMLIWFSISLIIIIIAVPWPFSPLANRPYFR
ncbi:MAG: hypothetical protein EOO04_38835 [Chitinophagaceae bacterium]|nr:MAG: hypothetical protein EOO04_38835 [Chitinophagaceae bacterium]